MKKLMFSTAAIVMALSFNAFAGTPKKAEVNPAETKSKSENVECYLDENNMFRVKGATGSCEEQPGKYCTYLYNGPEENPENDQEPSHYQPVGSIGYTWIP